MKDLLPVAAPGTGSNLFTSAFAAGHKAGEKKSLQSRPVMIKYPLFGALAQLVAHNTGSVRVRSSNLLCSTNPGNVEDTALPGFFIPIRNNLFSVNNLTK